MAITRKTVFDQLEITRNGGVQLRLALVIEEDGEELSTKYHRTVFNTADEVVPTMALVNEHLARLKAPPVPAAAITRIQQIVAAVEPYLPPRPPSKPIGGTP